MGRSVGMTDLERSEGIYLYPQRSAEIYCEIYFDLGKPFHAILLVTVLHLVGSS